MCLFLSIQVFFIGLLVSIIYTILRNSSSKIQSLTFIIFRVFIFIDVGQCTTFLNSQIV